MLFSVQRDRKCVQEPGSSGACLNLLILRVSFSIAFVFTFIGLGAVPALASDHLHTLNVTDHKLTSGTVIPVSNLIDVPDVAPVSPTDSLQTEGANLAGSGDMISEAINSYLTGNAIMTGGADSNLDNVRAERIIEITDSPGGGGFELDGAHYDGVTFTVSEASFPALTYVAGHAGSETVSARISDGAAWGEASVVNIVTSAGVEGVVVDLIKGEVFLPSQGWMTANAFFEYYYANGDVFSDVGYAQPLEALREFVQ